MEITLIRYTLFRSNYVRLKLYLKKYYTLSDN